MKLQDKHREFAVKCYAKFMNTNATIVFQFINYGADTETPTNHAEYHKCPLQSAFGVDLALQ